MARWLALLVLLCYVLTVSSKLLFKSTPTTSLFGKRVTRKPITMSIEDPYEINYCSTSNGGCSEFAVCTNTPGSASCFCGAGYSGVGTTCAACGGCNPGQYVFSSCTGGTVDNTACAACSPVEGCSSSLTCTSDTSSQCTSCAAGSVLIDNVAPMADVCEDINECMTSNGGCSEFAICTDIEGSRTCACQAGYTGDGLTCEEIIPNCDENNGGCDWNAQCCQVDPMVRPECKCNPGFYGDGILCTDMDECSSIQPCADGWACINVVGSYGCLPLAPYLSHDHDGHVKLRWRQLGDRPRLSKLSMRVTRVSDGVVIQTVSIKRPESADSVKIKKLKNGVEYRFQLIATTRTGDEIEGQTFTHTITRH